MKKVEEKEKEKVLKDLKRKADDSLKDYNPINGYPFDIIGSKCASPICNLGSKEKYLLKWVGCPFCNMFFCQLSACTKMCTTHMNKCDKKYNNIRIKNPNLPVITKPVNVCLNNNISKNDKKSNEIVLPQMKKQLCYI